MSPHTPSPVHDAHARDGVRVRLQAIEDALDTYLTCQGSVSSPQTPTLANNNVESRLSVLEAAIDHILTREAERQSLAAQQRSSQILDGRDPTSQHRAEILDGSDPTSPHSAPQFFDGRDLTPPHSAVPAIPVAGSSTGPGTLAGEPARLDTGARDSHVALALAAATWDDDDDDDVEYDDAEEYSFTDYTPEENAKVAELLNAIHDNYLLNKAK